MPRKSDTREKVFEAADALLQAGVRPTQQNVREHIGSGSITTINSALNLWWASLSERLYRKDQHPELPEPVITAANQLWDQALAYAHHALKRERDEIEQLIKERKKEGVEQLEVLRASVDRLQAQNLDIRSSNDELRNQVQQLNQKLLESESQLIRASSERDDFRRQVRQLEIVQERGAKGEIRSPVDSEALFNAKVEAKVNASKIKELELALEQRDQECVRLREALLAQEKEALQQRHRLELVIAQQDARYDDAISALTDCKKELSLAKSNP